MGRSDGYDARARELRLLAKTIVIPSMAEGLLALARDPEAKANSIRHRSCRSLMSRKAQGCVAVCRAESGQGSSARERLIEFGSGDAAEEFAKALSANLAES